MNWKKSVRVLIGLLIGIAVFWWVFRGTDWAEVWASIRRINPLWLPIMLAAIAATFFTRILRWRYIVRAGHPASFRHMFSATQIGFMVNFLLPMRIGEGVRALVLTRLTRIPFSKSLAMVTLDRVNDLIGLIVTMLIAAFAFRPAGDIVLPPDIYANPLPANLIRSGALGTGLFLIAIVSVLALLYVNRELALRLSDRTVGIVSGRLAGWSHHLLDQFAQGLHVFRSASDMAKSVFWGLVTWGLFVAINAIVLSAFGYTYPWYAPFVVTAVVSVAVSLPVAPGFIGQFHFAIVVGVSAVLSSVALPDAKAMAILAHLFNLVPILALGFFCLIWENLGLRDLTRATEKTNAQSAGAA
ncbi:MAG TPA: lysylphosphatidylglycerol synthase transmembrane domain-containing protein [Candidatus Hydrogenedentes bacterium]|nr:lysylphosphatidylglycerol synthase transmembrane domain-containing protein [Candidatus Hydrogenedentota bacterium]HPG70344.1 lysylphosphatidylglycerol synthase transmembrane domain-containing protein [Candidatus Hydrogenedentota bacterium]